VLITTPGDPAVEEELRRLQYSEEERHRVFRKVGPFPLDEWLRSGPPPTPAQLEEMEELLELRRRDRESSLAREAGLEP
jgi:hypothetical protein